MNSFRCPNCGFLNFAGSKSCKRCKTAFNQDSSDLSANKVDSDLLSNSENAFKAPPNSFTEAGNRQDIASPTSAEQNPAQQKSQNYNAPQPDQNSQPPRFAAPQPFLTQPSKLKSGLAIASMVMGCVGFILCFGMFGLLSIPGLIIGAIALDKSRRQPFKYGGKGFAIAGIVTNGLLVLMIPLTAAIAVPNLLAARRAANEGSAISSMQTLLGAESTFMRSNITKRCGDLSDLHGAGLIDSVLASGEKSGYKYVIAKSPNGTCELFAAPISPTGVAKTGTRSFYASTSEGEIRGADKNGAQANKNDPPLRLLDNSIEARRNSFDNNNY